MKSFTIQTPLLALVPASGTAARMAGTSARWAVAAKRNHDDVTGSPPRGAPV